MTHFFKKANKLKQEGKLEEAIVFYSEAIKKNRNFYWYHQNLGESLAKLGRFEEAIGCYDAAIEINPNSAWSFYKRGKSLELIGQRELAILSYRQAIELNPSFSGFYKSLGKALYQMALKINPEYLQKLKLDEVINGAYQENQKSISLYSLVDEEFLQATSELHDRDFLDALYSNYLQRQPDSQGKAHCLQLLERSMSRVELVVDIRNSPEFISLLAFSVTSFLLKEAILLYKLSIELNPKRPKNYQILSEVFNQLGLLLTQHNKLDEAIDIYREAIAIYPSELENKENGLSVSKKLAKLRNNQTQTGAVVNDLAWTYLHKGDALLQAGKIEEAIANYTKAIALNKNFPNPYLNLGYILFLKNQSHEAIKSYEQAIKLEPNWAYAYYSLGNVFLQNYQLEKAIESYQKALAIEPNWGELHCQIGNALLQQEKIDEALDSYQKALLVKSDWNAWSYFAQETVPLFYRDCLEGRVQICKQALTLKPDWIEAYYEAGNWLYHCGHLKSAMEFWSKCQQIQSELAAARQIDTQGYRFFAADFTRNIGHLGLLDFHIKMDILGLRPLNRAAIWAPPEHLVANRHLLNYWNKYIPVISDPSQHSDLLPLVKYAEERIATVTQSNGQTVYYFHALATVQKQWEAEARKPLLTLSDSDSKRGWSCLHSLGLPKDAWFVCLHVREVNTMENLRIDSVRNAVIDTYYLAIQTITNRGGWVIRIGDKKMKPLPSMFQTIDYAHSDLKSDWMDVFLLSQCRFHIGTNSGPFLVPPTFGVPCVITNWTPLFTAPIFGNSIFIPKLYWSESEKRYLTLSEAVSIPLGCGEYRRYYEFNKIRVRDNTSDEINDVVIEMLDRLEGKLEYTEQDEKLQKQWKNIIEGHGSYAISRMGRAFLGTHASLLARTPNESFPIFS